MSLKWITGLAASALLVVGCYQDGENWYEVRGSTARRQDSTMIYVDLYAMGENVWPFGENEPVPYRGRDTLVRDSAFSVRFAKSYGCFVIVGECDRGRAGSKDSVYVVWIESNGERHDTAYRIGQLIREGGGAYRLPSPL